MTDVEVAPLGEIAEITLGKTPARDDSSQWDPHRSTGNVWVTIADMTASTGTEIFDSKEYISDEAAAGGRLVPRGTLLLSFKLSIGKIAFAGTDLFTNEAIAALHLPADSRVSKEFLYHYLSSVDWVAAAQGNEKVKGATLNKAKLAVLPIPIPSIAVQKQIVEHLDAVVQQTHLVKCELRSRRSALRDLSSAIRRSIFEPKEGWSTKTIPDVSVNLDGLRQPVTKADRAAGPFPYYGASGVVDHVDGWIFDEPLLLVSEDGANLLARSTPIAFTASGKYWVNNHAHVLRFASDHLREYVAAYLNSVPIDAWVTGAAQPKLTQGNLNRIPIPVPDDEDEVVRAVESIRAADAIAAELEDIETQLEVWLGDLDRSLIAAAFRGEI